ncbi:MAG TPA: hypothetical protein VFL92_09730, partial [Sphingomonas sp.]|nr:hypothetical protein [Sphingomonas sp.]
AGMGAADHHHADPNAQPAQDGGRSDAGASFTPSGGGFGQAGGGGDAGRHAQARQQAQPQTFARAPRPAPSAPVSAAAHPARRSTDARYA